MLICYDVTMSLWLSVATAAVCIIVSEGKERTASLVVLPPLVIGYDELYNDSQPGDDKNQTQPKQGKKKIEEQENLNSQQAQSGPDAKAKRLGIAQRDTLIDVKGRRRNYRKFMRGRRRHRL